MILSEPPVLGFESERIHYDYSQCGDYRGANFYKQVRHNRLIGYIPLASIPVAIGTAYFAYTAENVSMSWRFSYLSRASLTLTGCGALLAIPDILATLGRLGFVYFSE